MKNNEDTAIGFPNIMFGWQNQWGFVTINFPTWNLKVWGTPKSKSPKPFRNSPKSVSTLRGSYGRCKGRCLIRVLTLGHGILPVNFRLKWLLWNLDMRFNCAGSRKVCGVVLGRGIFPVNFRIKWLVKSWHAFRLRRLAQSLRRGFDLQHFTCKFPHKVALVKSWHAFRLRRLAQVCVRVLGPIWAAAFFL